MTKMQKNIVGLVFNNGVCNHILVIINNLHYADNIVFLAYSNKYLQKINYSGMQRIWDGNQCPENETCGI